MIKLNTFTEIDELLDFEENKSKVNHIEDLEDVLTNNRNIIEEYDLKESFMLIIQTKEDLEEALTFIKGKLNESTFTLEDIKNRSEVDGGYKISDNYMEYIIVYSNDDAITSYINTELI